MTTARMTDTTIQKALSCSSLLSFNPFWVLVRLQNSVWEFLGFYFGPGDLSGFRFKRLYAQGIFLGLN